MPIKVLIVDDSAFMRQIITKMLDEDPEIQVIGTARDGADAISKVVELQPDVMTLDISMPNMDGLACLKHVMANYPLPVIMVSSLTVDGAEPTIKAFELGAVDYVTKSASDAIENVTAIQAELVQKIKVAATIKLINLKLLIKKVKPVPFQQTIDRPIQKLKNLKLLAIGTSTGGPRALHQLLPLFPKDFPLGIIVGQHMPKDITRVFAERLNNLCELEVKEAATGDEIRPGRILIAPSGKQTKVLPAFEHLVVEVSEEPKLLYKPSIDYLFGSIADACQGNVLSVIMTGMGNDGAVAMKRLRDLGGRTIAESEKSCVVYGMPRVAIEMGGAEFVEPLSNIYEKIVSIIASEF